jgi:hypothetical protein
VGQNKIPDKPVLLFLIMMAGITLANDPVLAHRFDVALVVPLSNAASVQGRQIRAGFMLATAERDSHPDQDSDGHLGGLDVYVRVIDGTGDVAADLGRMTARGEVRIVAAFGSETTLSLIRTLLDGTEIALLVPGQNPFSGSGLPAVAAFMSAYQRKYGARPSSHAARGYNAARRIDVAVRAQGGTDDTASLVRNFNETARGFTW